MNACFSVFLRRMWNRCCQLYILLLLAWRVRSLGSFTEGLEDSLLQLMTEDIVMMSLKIGTSV